MTLAALTASHLNSAIINGKDADDMIDEYHNSYMTKDDVGLKGTVSVLLSVLDQIKMYPSKADDSKSEQRTENT